LAIPPIRVSFPKAIYAMQTNKGLESLVRNYLEWA
jgi:hypothetical protein